MKHKPLTETEWLKVFRTRCKSKRGETLTPDEHVLIEKAFKQDQTRYAAMEPDVFDATVPVGSNAKWQRR